MVQWKQCRLLTVKIVHADSEFVIATVDCLADALVVLAVQSHVSIGRLIPIFVKKKHALWIRIQSVNERGYTCENENFRMEFLDLSWRNRFFGPQIITFSEHFRQYPIGDHHANTLATVAHNYRHNHHQGRRHGNASCPAAVTVARTLNFELGARGNRRGTGGSRLVTANRRRRRQQRRQGRTISRNPENPLKNGLMLCDRDRTDNVRNLD